MSDWTIDLAIRSMRKRYNMTQGDLEFLTGLRRSNISRLESGKVNPDQATINTLCFVLGLNPENLDPIWDIGDNLIKGPNSVSCAIRTKNRDGIPIRVAYTVLNHNGRSVELGLSARYEHSLTITKALIEEALQQYYDFLTRPIPLNKHPKNLTN